MWSRNEVGRSGFTMLELLVVISIIAIIATLAVGAATKAVKQSRSKRVDVTIDALEMALQNYRAQMGRWPFKIEELEKDPKEDNIFWAHSKDNVFAFRNLYHGKGPSKTVYLDASALFTEIDGRRCALTAALALRDNFSIGYAFPQNPSLFCNFCVEYRTLTDTVKVHRQDMRKAPYRAGSVDNNGDRIDGDHTCPNGYWGKAN